MSSLSACLSPPFLSLEKESQARESDVHKRDDRGDSALVGSGVTLSCPTPRFAERLAIYGSEGERRTAKPDSRIGGAAPAVGARG